jgi:hypothetical protein
VRGFGHLSEVRLICSSAGRGRERMREIWEPRQSVKVCGVEVEREKEARGLNRRYYHLRSSKRWAELACIMPRAGDVGAAQRWRLLQEGKRGEIALGRNKASFAASKRPQSCVGHHSAAVQKFNPNANVYVPCRARSGVLALHAPLSRIERVILTSFSHCSERAKLATPSLSSILRLSEPPTVIRVLNSPCYLDSSP